MGQTSKGGFKDVRFDGKELEFGRFLPLMVNRQRGRQKVSHFGPQVLRLCDSDAAISHKH